MKTMKLNYKILFFILSICIITCANVEANTLFERNDSCNILQGNYFSSFDTSEVIVKKNTNNEYIMSIFLFRLLQIDDVKSFCKNSKINFILDMSEDNKIYGEFFKNKKEYILEIKDSNWEYLPNGTKYNFTKK